MSMHIYIYCTGDNEKARFFLSFFFLSDFWRNLYCWFSHNIFWDCLLYRALYLNSILKYSMHILGVYNMRGTKDKNSFLFFFFFFLFGD